MRPFKKTLVDRFWPRVNKSGNNGCWEWMGCRTGAGYGQIGAQGTREILYTHRVSWELHNGPIPKGLFVLHRCDNPSCCNPAHLFAGTHLENMQDCHAKGRSVHFTHPNSFPIGEKAALSKLSDADSFAMIALVKSGVPRATAAKKYGVTVSLISKILTNKCRRRLFAA